QGRRSDKEKWQAEPSATVFAESLSVRSTFPFNYLLFLLALLYGHRVTQALRAYQYPAKSGRGSAEKNLSSTAGWQGGRENLNRYWCRNGTGEKRFWYHLFCLFSICLHEDSLQGLIEESMCLMIAIRLRLDE